MFLFRTPAIFQKADQVIDGEADQGGAVRINSPDDILGFFLKAVVVHADNNIRVVIRIFGKTTHHQSLHPIPVEHIAVAFAVLYASEMFPYAGLVEFLRNDCRFKTICPAAVQKILRPQRFPVKTAVDFPAPMFRKTSHAFKQSRFQARAHRGEAGFLAIDKHDWDAGVFQKAVCGTVLLRFNAAEETVDLPVQKIFQGFAFLFRNPAGQTQKKLIARFDRLPPCRRILVMAAEDVGLAYPQIIPIVRVLPLVSAQAVNDGW